MLLHLTALRVGGDTCIDSCSVSMICMILINCVCVIAPPGGSACAELKRPAVL